MTAVDMLYQQYLGVATNVDFQLKLIRRPEFLEGNYDNGFLNRTDILADERSKE